MGTEGGRGGGGGALLFHLTSAFLRCDIFNTPILAVYVERRPAALSGHHVSMEAPVKSTHVRLVMRFFWHMWR